MISVEIVGVERFRANARRALAKLRAKAVASTRLVAEDTKEWLRDQITNRKLGLEEVSEAWAARKEDPSAPPLINTGEYVGELIVRPTVRGHMLDLSNDLLRRRAIWLEFGTKNTPARPHWRPAADYAQQHIAPRRGRAVLEDVAKELAKK